MAFSSFLRRASPLTESRTVYHIRSRMFKMEQNSFICWGASSFFTHAYWDLETTMTTFKNNMILRAHLEHSESWQFEDRQMGAGE